jgi:hypothetical protein
MPGIKDGFWGKVSVGHPGGCWGWIGSTDSGGYGQLQHNGKLQPAHRVAWMLVNGPLPEGLWVLHRCDNPPCTNPDHLFLGTRRDNMMDASHKGRMLGRRKLTPDDVRAIRASGLPQVELARQYGLTSGAVSMIISRRRWSGISME